MARYLTPGKLSTLILTEIHLLSDEPFSPGLLDVLSSHVLPTHYASSSIDGLASDLSKSSDVQSLCVSLQALPSSLPGRTAFDFFLSQAWACVDLDSLHGLFDRLHRLAHPEQVEDRRISPASPLGSFLRRCLVEWTRLQFADSLALLEVFRLWLEPTRERWSRIDPEGATHLAAKEVCHKASSAAFASQELSISSEDVEVALTHSISVLQRIGQRMPSDLKHKISSWSRQLSSQSLAHFMAFYESWRAGEYTMALENLHRYFDYSLSASRAVEDAAGPRVQYQYALLHLSVLHADFERWQESVESMEECVITARENQDTPCLLFALAYLLHLRQIHPNTSPQSLSALTALAGNGGGQDELAFLKLKAREGRHHSLAATTLLEEARLELRRSGSPPKSLECHLQASHLAAVHGLHNLSSSITMFEGGIADRVGQQRLSANAYDYVRSSTDPQCSISDRVRAGCRYAYQLACKGSYDAANNTMQGLHELAQQVPKLAQRATNFSNLIALHQSLRRARPGAARHYLKLLCPYRHSDSEVKITLELLELKYLMRTCDLTPALSKVNALLDHARTNQEGDIAHTLSLLTAKAQLFLAASRPLSALSVVLRTTALASSLHTLSCLLLPLAQNVQILLALGEFQAALDLGETVLPFAVESEDGDVEARLWGSLCEACVGLANPEVRDSGQVDVGKLARALVFVDRGYQVSKRLQDSDGELKALVMRSRICAALENKVGMEEAEQRALQLIAERRASQE